MIAARKKQHGALAEAPQLMGSIRTRFNRVKRGDNKRVI